LPLGAGDPLACGFWIINSQRQSVNATVYSLDGSGGNESAKTGCGHPMQPEL
jgi:hypothetical protein